MVRPSRTVVLIGVLIVSLIGTAVVLLSRQGGSPREVDAYLAAWSRLDYEAMRALVDGPPQTFVGEHEAASKALRVVHARFSADDVERDGGQIRAPFTATLQLQGLGEWRYEGSLHLARRGDRWLVRWTPATVHPELRAGLRLSRQRSRPPRGDVLGTGDQPLTRQEEVIAVGVEPGRIRDRAQVAAALARHAGLDPARLDAALSRPGVQPDHFLPLVYLRPDRYSAARPVLAPVPGIVFRRQTARTTLSEGFARHVVGHTGEVTAERLQQLGIAYQSGDEVGLSGLEAAFERELAGTPSGEVRLADGSGATVKVLHRFPGAPPAPVRTTLDPALQMAGEAALQGVAQPAAIVAVDGNDGSIRAVASRPLDQPFNRALAGRYPPGSTFKVVTTTALLAAGVTPATRVDCPAEATVGGKRFTNFESQALGPIPFSVAFVQSCNTAFVSQAAKIRGDALVKAAEGFGFGANYDVGLPAAGGRFPPPKDDAELAAAAIGQGRVEASPLHMATVAAASAAGSWRPPVLLTTGRPPRAAPRPLDAGASKALQDLMAGVVREGTGVAARAPGVELGGKTGTAEFGPGTPPATHAWFIGHFNNVGFAVLVEGGGVAGRVAAPIAGRFVARASRPR